MRADHTSKTAKSQPLDSDPYMPVTTDRLGMGCGLPHGPSFGAVFCLHSELNLLGTTHINFFNA